jgi:photosystem II stability/assembly factor-like uncharacterized protein
MRFPAAGSVVLALSLVAPTVLAAPGSAPARPARPAHTAALAPAVDPALLAPMRWRSIGPYRGGRVAAVSGVVGQPRTFYMGATGGGVWRSDDAGASWRSLADSSFGTGSVGAIAVAPSDPNVVYVGMGETPIRGNVSHGDGLYRSTDAGQTWRHIGLARTSQVARIRVHPRDPDLVYVAAQGRVFGPNPERGVYRSRDGGATWERILAVDDRTGASDIAMDPLNPRVLYAGFWQVVRRPWTLESGGPGSSLWKSTDGGDTWTRLTGQEGNGLPKGVLGKIGIAVSPVQAGRVFAMIEAEAGGLFRSDNGGRDWQRVHEDRRLRQRAWYYTDLACGTANADEVWVLNVSLHRSRDGGRSFDRVDTPHGDNHELWIDPADPERMVLGNDGGATVTVDGGGTWTPQDNQPTAQFYRITTDDQFPYRIYGAQQDNSTVSIPHRTTGYGIEREDWFEVGGCESGWIAPHPRDPQVVFAGCYMGYLSRLDLRTRQQREVTVYPESNMGAGADSMRFRFQWNFPILFSRHDPGTLWAAGNVLFRTRDEGQSWQVISPDLTRDDASKQGPSGGPITKDNTSVEYHGTIFALSESPVQKGVLWAGSDDGRIHVTRDEGGAWQEVTPPGIPQWGQVNSLDASPHDAGTVWAAVTAYKLDDFAPYVLVTRDFGRSWRRVTAGLPDGSFVRVVREDPVRRDLVYAGTETGVWVSFDGGGRWQSLQHNLPTVPVTDLTVKDGDLCVGTQGRAFWVLDDLSSLRQLTPAVAAAEVHLFEPRTTVRTAGAGVPRTDAGSNPPAGVRVRYALRSAPADSVRMRLEFLDGEGRVLRAFDRGGEMPADTADTRREGAKVPARAGLNEFTWDLRERGAFRVPGTVLWSGSPEPPMVVPGRYTVRLSLGTRQWTQPVQVVRDPRLTTSDADFVAQRDLLRDLRDRFTRAHDAVARIRSLRGDLDAVVERAERAGQKGALADSAKALQARLTQVEEALHQTQSRSNQDPLNFPVRLDDKLASLSGTVASADARPTAQALDVHRDLAARVDRQLARLQALLDTDLAAFNRMVEAQRVPAVVPARARVLPVP